MRALFSLLFFLLENFNRSSEGKPENSSSPKSLWGATRSTLLDKKLMMDGAARRRVGIERQANKTFIGELLALFLSALGEVGRGVEGFFFREGKLN